MNDEIREILDKWKDKDGTIKVNLSLDGIRQLEDYITNLQKEIHKQIHTSIVQKKQINNLQKRNSRQRLANQKQQYLILKLQDENQRLKEDKKKAAEYINKYEVCLIKNGIPEISRTHLLNILQNGSDDNG